MRSSSKVTFFSLLLPLGLLTAGCSGMGVGKAGVDDVIAGNWDGARIEFTRDYQDKPDHPIAVFNMGVTHQHDGDIGKADSLFSEAAVRGKGYVPHRTLELLSSGRTVAEHACARLHRDNRLDASCGDQIALEAPVAPPAPIAQATREAPAAVEAQATREPPAAVEAQATTVPAAPPAPLRRKQDRN
jgi:hypothetical protein